MEPLHSLAFEPSTSAPLPDSGGEADQPTSAAPPCQWTLSSLLEATSSLNNVIDSPEWNPSDIIGPLGTAEETGDELRDHMRRKVDSIDHVVREFEDYAERQAKRAQLIIQRSSIALKRAASLKQYVQSEMERQGLEQLTGNDRVILRKKSSNPSFAMTRPPTDSDMVNLGEDFVRTVPASYSWNAKFLIKEMKAGMHVEFGYLDYSYSLKFDDLDKPAVAERKPRKKK